jgi:hypothetical protein
MLLVFLTSHGDGRLQYGQSNTKPGRPLSPRRVLFLSIVGCDQLPSCSCSLIIIYLVLHSPNDCNDGGTTINTASQYQIEDFPADVLNYKYIGVTAVLGSSASVTVTVGGHAYPVGWQSEPAGGVGVYHGSVYITTTGAVSADLIRNSATILTVTGEAIGGCTEGGYANLNPFVAGDFVSGKISVETPHDISDLVCTQGSGAEGFASMCLVVCEYGYCPIGGEMDPSLPVFPPVFSLY